MDTLVGSADFAAILLLTDVVPFMWQNCIVRDHRIHPLYCRVVNVLCPLREVPLYIIATKTVKIDQLFHSKHQLDIVTILELTYVGGLIILKIKTHSGLI